MDQTIPPATKQGSIQDRFLSDLQNEKTEVCIYLINGIKLSGIIAGYDQYTVLLASDTSQMVNKHAISTIMPDRGRSAGMPASHERARPKGERKPIVTFRGRGVGRSRDETTSAEPATSYTGLYSRGKVPR